MNRARNDLLSIPCKSRLSLRGTALQSVTRWDGSPCHAIRNGLLCVTIVAGGILGSPRAGSQSVLYVDASAAGINNGADWCNAFTRLQDALAAASSDGSITEIRVAGGIYRPDQGEGQLSGDRLATFTLLDGVALRGGYAGCGAADPDGRDFALHETTLNGDLGADDNPNFANRTENSYHVVTYSDPNATGVLLEGFTVTGGYADGAAAPFNQGGAVNIRDGLVKCVAGGPTLRHCVFRDNWASHHGAVNDHGLATVIEHCTFHDNYAGHEGAGLLVHSGGAVIRNCTFAHNVTDGEGGGAWNGHDDDPTCSAPSAPRYEDCVFLENQALKGGGMFNIGSNPTLVNCTFSGSGILSGNTAFVGAGLYSQQSNLALTNCTFRFGLSQSVASPPPDLAPRGGGMYSLDSNLTLVDCAFEDNHVYGFGHEPPFGGGGGMYNEGGLVTLTNCTFTRNEGGQYGSGIANDNTMITLQDCTFEGNKLGYGGAIGTILISGSVTANGCTFRGNGFGNIGGAILASNLTLTDCLFEGNHSSVSGGAINASGPVSVTNCRFLGNVAGIPIPDSPNPSSRGGAMQLEAVTGTITNCIFSGNFADLKGGALNVVNGGPTIANCTFYGNTAFTAGGALRSWGSAVPKVNNCVFWSNSGATGADETGQFWLDNGGTIQFHHSCVQGWTGALGGTGNFSSYPLFMDADGPDDISGTEDDDLRLASVSPAVDAGDNAEVVLAEDIEGNARIADGTVDLGAYEFHCQPGPFGDVDWTGVVDSDDILCVLGGFVNRPDCAEADLMPCGTGDGVVDVDDLLAILATFVGLAPCPDPCPV